MPARSVWPDRPPPCSHGCTTGRAVGIVRYGAKTRNVCAVCAETYEAAGKDRPQLGIRFTVIPKWEAAA